MSKRRASSESPWWWLGQALIGLFAITIFVLEITALLVVAVPTGAICAVAAITGHRAFARRNLKVLDPRGLWSGMSL